MENWIKEKSEVNIQVDEMCLSGGKNRIVVKCKNEEEKKEIMKNKKIGRKRVYKDNDLT